MSHEWSLCDFIKTKTQVFYYFIEMILARYCYLDLKDDTKSCAIIKEPPMRLPISKFPSHFEEHSLYPAKFSLQKS